MADYKAALETMNVEMELLRRENADLQNKVQDLKEDLDDAQRRPRWDDCPDGVGITGGMLGICGVDDRVSDGDFDLAAAFIKGHFAEMFPPDMRPDFPLKTGWDGTP